MTQQRVSPVIIRSQLPATVTQIVQGASGQSADLMQWQNSSGTVLLAINSAGQIAPATAASVGLVIKGLASQSGDYFQVQNSGGTVLAKIDNSYGLTLSTSGRFNGGLGINGNQIGVAWFFVNIGSAGDKGAVIRGASGQTADLTQWQNSAGTVLASVAADGVIRSNFFTNVANNNAYIDLSTNSVGVINRTTTSNVVLIVKGIASQTADLQQWQNSSGTVLASVKSNGSVTGVYFGSATSSTAYIQPNLSSGALGILTAANANIGLIIRGNSSQTANLQEWQESGGQIRAYITSNGLMRIRSANSTLTSFAVTSTSASQVPVTIEGQVSQTANLQEWQDSTPTVQTAIGPTGRILSGQRMSIGYAVSAPVVDANINFGTGASDRVGVLIRGVASQTADLQQWQNSAGTVLSSISAGGGVTHTIGVGSPFVLRISSGDQRFAVDQINGLIEMVYNGGNVTVGNDGTPNFAKITTGKFNVGTANAASIGIVVVGATSQSADLQQWQNYARTSVAKVDASGNVTAASFVKTGGTSSQFLKADGSVDSSTYLTTGTASSTYLPLTGGTISSNLTVTGNLTVNGTTTNLNSTNLVIEDKNIILGDVATPSNTTADGGGITLLGATDKTFNWINSTASWTSSENLDLAATKVLKIGGTEVLSASQYTGNAATVTNGVYTTGTQTISGDKTFTGNVNIAGVLDLTNTGVISALDMSNNTITGVNALQFADPGPGEGLSWVNGNFSLFESPDDLTTNTGGNLQIVTGSQGAYTKRATFSSTGAFEVPSGSITGYSFIPTSSTVPTNGMYLPAANTIGFASNSALRMIINSAGKLVYGHTTIEGEWYMPSGTGHKIYVIDNVSTNTAGGNMWIARHNGTPGITIARSNGTNIGDRGIVAAGDILGSIQFAADDGTSASYSRVGRIQVVADGTIGVDQIPSYMSFQVGAISGGLDTEWMRLNYSGSLGLGTATHATNVGLYARRGLSGNVNSYGIISDGQVQSDVTTKAVQFYSSSRTANAIFTLSNFYHFEATQSTLSNITAGGALTNQVGYFVDSTLTGATNNYSFYGNIPLGTNRWNLYMAGTAANYFAGQTTINSTSTALGGGVTTHQFGVVSSAAGNTAVAIRGAASQTGSLTEWQSSAGTVLATINASGELRGPGFGNINTFQNGMFYPQDAGPLIYTGQAANVALRVRNGNASPTANLQEWQNSAGTALSSIDASGNAQFPIVGVGSTALATLGGTLRVMNSGPAAVGITVRGAASQSANLQEWQNSAGTAVTYITAAGKFISTANLVVDYAYPNYLMVGTGENFVSGTSAYFKTINASTIGIIVRATASQTANLQEWQSPTGAVVAKIEADGALDVATARINSITGSGGSVVRAQFSGTLASVTTTAATSTYISLLVKGAASQSANLQEWRNSADTVLSYVRNDGVIFASGGLQGSAWLSAGSFISGAQLISNIGTASHVGILVRGAASQTGDLQQWQNSAGTILAEIDSAGLYTGAPAAGTTSTAATNVGYMGMPQNALTATGTYTYTFAASDAGKHVYVTGTPTSATLTINSNANLALPIGTTFVVMNDLGAATNISIAITTDTLQLAGTGTTGTRTLARYGMATIVKVTSTKWIISGNGLT